MSRDFDLVLYGTTGATGRQAAAYLAACASPGLRWAAAGRDRSRLSDLGLKVPMLVANSRDAEQLDDLAGRTRLVLNMAGPSREHGSKQLSVTGKAAPISCAWPIRFECRVNAVRLAAGQCRPDEHAQRKHGSDPFEREVLQRHEHHQHGEKWQDAPR